MPSQAIIQDLQNAVLLWYRQHGRHHLPWRNLSSLKHKVDPLYGTMVAELMLQQTQVDRVIPKYRAFLDHFPTVQSLASALPAMVITLWSGLGYNRRAILLHQAAQIIVHRYNGIIPTEQSALESLPGIGTYTAAAMLAFGLNRPVVVMDTNIMRFYELLFFGYSTPNKADLTAFAAPFVPLSASREWHSALMDITSAVRSLKSPHGQRVHLLKLLQIIPAWELPLLTHTPFSRPKQNQFRQSTRYYRGKIIAYLREAPDHKRSLASLMTLMQQEQIPENCSLNDLVAKLKRDGLVAYLEPLTNRTIVRLP